MMSRAAFLVVLLAAAPSAGAQPCPVLPVRQYATGGGSNFAAFGDLNGDGYADAVATSTNAAVGVLLGSPTGLGAPTLVPAAPYPSAIEIVDLDADGALDLAVSGWPDRLELLVGDGAGGFAPLQSVTVGAGAGVIASGDLNGDGLVDLAVANREPDDVSILLGQGSGFVGVAPKVPVGDHPAALLLVDLNLDGDLDLVTGHALSNDVWVRAGNGHGGFLGAVEHGPIPGVGVRALATGDVDSDGAPDLVVGSQAGPVSFLLGNGQGGLGPPSPVGVVGRCEGVLLADVTGDANPDVVATDFMSGEIVLFVGDGAGGFAPPSPTYVGGGPWQVRRADVDGDGHADVAAACALSGIAVARGRLAGGLVVPDRVAVGDGPVAAALADLDGDGDLDLATANRDGNDLSIRYGNASGGFVGGSDLPAGFDPRTVGATDLDGDGRLDLVAGGADGLGGASVTVLANGVSGFGPAKSYAAGVPPFALVPGDVDNDGADDVVVAGPYGTSGNAASLLLGDGLGGFGAPVALAPGSAGTSVGLADVDLDGLLDVAVSHLGGGVTDVHWAGGSSALATGEQPVSLVLDDFDADGAPDLAVANEGSADLTLLRGLGAAGFLPPASVALSSGPTFVAAADVDVDGRRDLVVAAGSTQSVLVLRGDGVGGFGAPLAHATGESPRHLAVGDVDLDGRPDLVIPVEAADRVTVHRNEPESCAFSKYGSGCAGASGTPKLTGSGQAVPGGVVLLAIENGPAHAAALLLFGLGEGGVAFNPFCVLHVAPLAPLVLSLPLGPNGGALLAGAIPPGVTPGVARLQALVADPLVPGGAAATNALRIDVGP
ncbi:MAG: FG-GAP repeat domain-containing protein [Planctomycetota bacterium JB042]